MPIPKGVDPEKYRNIEDALAREGRGRNKYALATWIAKHGGKGKGPKGKAKP